MLVIVLIVVALVAFALLWRWSSPTNPVPRTPDDHRTEHAGNGDPIAEQSGQESDAQIAPWIGGNG
jgi:hypothetical protein